MNKRILTLTKLASMAAVSTAFADFPGAVTTDGPLAYYRFEEAPGATTLVDSSGNGLDIDYSAPVGTTVLGEAAAIGLGALFSGDDAIVTPLLLDPSAGDFTIEAVVSAGVFVGDGVVLSNQDGTLGPGRSNLVVNGNRFITTFSGGATTNSGVIASEGGFDHIILTFDQSAVAGGVDPTFRFYINGVEANSSLIVPEPANGNWVIGANKVLTTQLFSGLIDEIAVYDKRLDDVDGDGDVSDSRVSAHYKEYLADSETVVSFESNVPYLDSGSSADLSWLVSPVLTSLTLDDGSGPVDVLPQTVECLGALTVSPTVTTTYTLSGDGPQGPESLEVTVVVDESAVVESFTSNFSQIPAGGEVILSWEVTNGISVSIDNGVGAVDAMAGSVVVTVNDTATYTLTANNSQGDVTSQVTVEALILADPTLIAHWKVGEAPGETDGTTLVSESGAGFAGTFVGTPTFDLTDAAPVPGGSTASLVFDGNDSWVDVLGYNGIGGADARTVAFWFKGSATQANNNATLVSWGTGTTGERWDVRVKNNPQGVLRTEVSGSGSDGTAIMADDTWHHCAVVFDPNTGTTIGDVLFYIDGQVDPLAAPGGTTINTSTAFNLRIGASRALTTPSRALTGKMDDIRIYTRALTAGEIADLVEPLDIPLEVTGIERLENGSVVLSWSGSPGEYSLEYTTDLSSPSWFELSDNEVIADGETTGTSTDSSVATNPANTKIFYRFRKVD
ncbi:LamG domain-containing protein [Akkermansiaceae bacterium]|nr:LamG domain-containing protein [Akkermansiaceae bacterium]